MRVLEPSSGVIARTIRRRAYAALSLLTAAGLVFATAGPALAATLSSASVTLSDSQPSATSVSYDFQASNVTTSNIQCIQLEFDTNASGTGGLPSGMNIASADISGSSDYVPTPANWSPTVTGNIVEFNEATAGETPASSSARNLIVTGITNGDTVDTSYYLIVKTYNNQDCTSSQVDSATVQFIFTDGTDVSLTVDPAFTFTVAGVSSGNDVDSDDSSSEDTTVTSTATTIPFSNSVTTSVNGIGAQDLTINTNAQNGYSIYFRQTQALTNGGTDTIDAVSVPQGTDCTYAVPRPFTAAGNEAFGFTTDDADISSGLYQDGSGSNDWCDALTSNQEVAKNTSSLSGSETTRVSYQVGISAATEAGTYTNTIIYTAVPNY